MLSSKKKKRDTSSLLFTFWILTSYCVVNISKLSFAFHYGIFYFYIFLSRSTSTSAFAVSALVSQVGEGCFPD